MKYAFNSFVLEANIPVAIQGNDSLYTFQNITNSSITVLGSNNSTDWVSLCVVNAANAKTTHSAFKFLCINSGTLLVNRAAAGSSATTALVNESGTEVSSSNPLPVAEVDGLSVSGTATSAAVLFTTSMVNYESITVQITSAGTGCTITYEQSEDQTTWYSVSGISVTNAGASAPSSGTAAAAMYIFPRRGTYFRARVVTYGSGTVALTGALSKTSVNLTIEARLGGYANEGAAIINQPVPIALEGRTSSKTSVTSGQAVRPISTVDGRQIVRLDAIPENEWSYVAASGGITNTTTPVTMVAAAGSGIRNYITSLQVSSDTLGIATEVVIQDGAGGAILWRSKIGTVGIVGIQNIRFHPPIRGSSNTLLQFYCLTATGIGSIYLNAQGYKAP